jgi:hypothetical protein
MDQVDLPIGSDDPDEISSALQQVMKDKKGDRLAIWSILGPSLGPEASPVWRSQAGSSLASVCQWDGQMNRDSQIISIALLFGAAVSHRSLCQVLVELAERLAEFDGFEDEDAIEELLVQASKACPASRSAEHALLGGTARIAIKRRSHALFVRVFAALPHRPDVDSMNAAQDLMRRAGIPSPR